MRDLVRCFEALADPTRLRIVHLLAGGELCVCDIQRVLAAAQPNVSRHLSYLKHRGLVSDRREGQRVYYRLAAAEAPARRMLAAMRRILAADPAMARDLRVLRRALRSGRCAVPLTSQRARGGA